MAKKQIKLMLALTITEEELARGNKKGTIIKTEMMNIRAEKVPSRVRKNMYQIQPMTPVVTQDSLVTDPDHLREQKREDFLKVVDELATKLGLYGA